LPADPLHQHTDPQKQTGRNQRTTQRKMIELQKETTQPASQPARLSACFLKTSPSERKNLQLFDIIKIKRIPYLQKAEQTAANSSPKKE